MNSTFFTVVLGALAIIYIVSPVDFCPGPIDDFIVMLLTMAAQKRIGTSDSVDL